MYKHTHTKRLSKKMSDRATRGWRTRRLIQQANPRPMTADEAFEKAKQDQKGRYFATWSRDGFRMTLYHSMSRSDQFDVIIETQSKWNKDTWKVKKMLALSLPKCLNEFRSL